MITKGLTALMVIFGLGSTSFASLGAYNSTNMTDKSVGEVKCDKTKSGHLGEVTNPKRTAAKVTKANYAPQGNQTK